MARGACREVARGACLEVGGEAYLEGDLDVVLGACPGVDQEAWLVGASVTLMALLEVQTHHRPKSLAQI